MANVPDAPGIPGPVENPAEGPPPIGYTPPNAAGGAGSPVPPALTSQYISSEARKRLLQAYMPSNPTQMQLQGAPQGAVQLRGGSSVMSSGPGYPSGGQLGQGMNPGYSPYPTAGGNPYADAGNIFAQPSGQFSTNQGVQTLLGGGYNSGAFNPTGQGFALDALQRYLQMVGGGQVRAAQLGAQLYNPDDPMMNSYARINATNAAQSNLMQGLGNAQSQFALNNMNFLHNLLPAYMALTMQPKQSQGGQYAQAAGALLGSILGPASAAGKIFGL